MSRLSIVRTAFCALLLAGSTASFAADPSMDQVYQAANAGNYREAQGMMDQVLRDHPNSAKAHFVEAELLAKQGKLSGASAELATAERIKPDLTFAKPGAVEELKARLNAAPIGAAGTVVERAPQPASGFPWGLLAGGVILLAAIMFFLRARQPVTVMPASGGYGYGPQPYGVGGVGPMAPPGGGMGSGILGGLASGAALGGGIVAGEMLAHRLLDGGQHSNGGFIPDNSPIPDESQYDMGGNDFGVADNSSWDDSSGGGGGDWG